MAEINSITFQIDKNIPIPLYYELEQQILELIKNKNLQVGDMLPPENELCEQLGISRPTVRQAMMDLVATGHLVREKSRGTFVASPKIDEKFFTRLQSFNDEMFQKGFKPSTQVISLEKIPSMTNIAEKLQIPLDSEMIKLERLRYANDDPVVYLQTFIPYKGYENLMKIDFAVTSLYSIMEELLGIKVYRVFREIEAINATRKEADLLKINSKGAICLVKTVAYTKEDLPVEYSIARYRGDRNKFSISLIR